MPNATGFTGNALELAAELRSAIRGEVRFDEGSRALYSTDASNYRQVPIGVVLPTSAEDIVEAVRVCRKHGAPILPRGGGTSQCGQCVNIAVVIDTSKYFNRVLEIDEKTETARVEPGVVCDALRNAAEQHHLTFGPDPATHSRCTLGGMIGNNSCGAHSVMAGKTEENVEALEILTYDGARFWVGPTSEAELDDIIRAGGRQGDIYARLRALRDRYADQIRAGFPKIRRCVSGYNLHQLLPETGFNLARALVGSEGTCALTLQAKTRLVHSPQGRVLLVLGFADIYRAGDSVPAILPFKPIATEGLDLRIIGGLRERKLRLEDLELLPPGTAWLLVEFGAATRDQAAARARELMQSLESQPGAPSMALFADPKIAHRMWTLRETAASATALNLDRSEPDPIVGWEDAAVDPARLGDYLREFQRLIDRHGYKTSLYGHFGDGCIHARITFDLRTRDGLRVWRAFLTEASQLVVKYGGSLSGEHGDGQGRGEFLPIMYGEELMQAFREFKAIWDPYNKMNPGKLINAYPVDVNLRLGPDYQPLQLPTQFSFYRDDRQFSRAVERCIGMGKCRGQEGGTMCPSYRATGEEKHSTRGRSRMLFEMLQGDVIRDRWHSEAVKDALDLCLACKGCRGDCPTQVDMATYKAEFMSHYYETKRRPLRAYAMGMIHRWAPLAANMPGMVNFLGRAPVLKRIAGIAPERQLPKFASPTFRRWFERRAPHNERKPKVILWPDTFNNHFHPETAIATVEVLETAGFQVTLPKRRLCCGRALYDFGWLVEAKRLLQEILEALREDISAVTPVVGLEPACVAVFRDELLNLFPEDELAQRLSRQTFLLSEFLVKAGYEPPRLAGTALVHGHCHQKAIMGMGADAKLLDRLGLDYELLDSGCCGMAGSFGFDQDKYELSIKIGERVLLPAVRETDKETLIVSSGFSCREQITQATGRAALHIAEVIRMAIQHDQLPRPAKPLPHHAEPGDEALEIE
jgi:FAD/FMN-containing dehydrogenase/Fe-S oxidoreductase